MPDSYKTFWWNVHKKSSYTLYTGYCKLLPLTFFAIIFYIVSNGIFIHSYDSVVADGDTMRVFSQIVYDGLCTIKGFLAMRNPFFIIAGIQKFFESILMISLYEIREIVFVIDLRE